MLDGDPATSPKRGQSLPARNFRPMFFVAKWLVKMPLVMDVGLGLGDFALGGTQFPLKWGTVPCQILDQSTVAKQRDGSRCHWVQRQASTLATLCKMGPSSPLVQGHGPSIFGQCLLWPNGRPSQLLLSSCTNGRQKSSYLSNGLTDRCKIWHDDAL